MRGGAGRDKNTNKKFLGSHQDERNNRTLKFKDVKKMITLCSTVDRSYPGGH